MWQEIGVLEVGEFDEESRLVLLLDFYASLCPIIGVIAPLSSFFGGSEWWRRGLTVAHARELAALVSEHSGDKLVLVPGQGGMATGVPTLRKGSGPPSLKERLRPVDGGGIEGGPEWEDWLGRWQWSR